jgi:uncharacterized membrane protein YccC
MADNAALDLIGRRALFWVLLEVFVALAIAVAIVWWTFPRRPKGDEEREGGDKG